MSACEALTAEASLGAAPALRAVDCLANEAAGRAFGRLFGTDGALLPALTIVLTLYIAFFAVSLLTGRSRLGVAALTPRMMTLGLVLTFATSWVAWQVVVWNLAIGAPDQLAGILVGAPSDPGQTATGVFADKLDMIFAAIAQAGDLAGSGQAAPSVAAAGGFTPPNLMWLGALLLLLGTVGVLVTARIALAVLLALGPVFVVFALFGGTRGLFVGWLRGVVMTAVTPLFVVLGGGLMLELIVPVIANLIGESGISGQAAMALFLIAAVHVALMAMVLKVTGAMVAGWQVFGLAAKDGAPSQAAAPAQAAPGHAAVTEGTTQPLLPAQRRGGAALAASAPQIVAVETTSSTTGGDRRTRTMSHHIGGGGNGFAPPPLPARRARGVGSRFRAPTHHRQEMFR